MRSQHRTNQPTRKRARAKRLKTSFAPQPSRVVQGARVDVPTRWASARQQAARRRLQKNDTGSRASAGNPAARARQCAGARSSNYSSGQRARSERQAKKRRERARLGVATAARARASKRCYWVATHLSSARHDCCRRAVSRARKHTTHTGATNAAFATTTLTHAPLLVPDGEVRRRLLRRF